MSKCKSGGRRHYQNVGSRKTNSSAKHSASTSKKESNCNDSDSSCTILNNVDDDGEGRKTYEENHQFSENSVSRTVENLPSDGQLDFSTAHFDNSLPTDRTTCSNEQMLKHTHRKTEEFNRDDHGSSANKISSSHCNEKNINSPSNFYYASEKSRGASLSFIGMSCEEQRWNPIVDEKGSGKSKELDPKHQGYHSNLHDKIRIAELEIKDLTTPHTINHFKEIAKISESSGDKNGWNNLKDNLISQLSNFDGFIANCNRKLHNLYDQPLAVVLEEVNKILDKVKNECMLFSKAVPAYCLKNEIESALTTSRVIVISCDSVYCCNVVVPLLIQSVFSTGMIASCEVNGVTALTAAHSCCSLIGQKPGNLVGYDIVQQSLLNENTNILYTTVKNLLSCSLKDKSFTKYSCIILNELLSRSIEADVLLASLRDCLSHKDSKREDLKLVVLAATERVASSMTDYFSSSGVATTRINTQKLVFPVKVMWKKEFCHPDEDFFPEMIDVCLGIHLLKRDKPGNVLVFLPTENDAVKAAELTNNRFLEYSISDVHCIHINWKNTVMKLLQQLEQKEQQHSKRSIFFVSDGFEVTSLPHVRYVVDSGRSSKICYDPEKKLEVQKTSFISQSRSKIRKICAGRYFSGECYRMYCCENYKKSMIPHELPELLRRSPLHSVVKIVQYGCGIQGVLQNTQAMEFVEPMPAQVKENALKSLQELGAIEDGQLTCLGESMIKLRFVPKLSKLIILGVEEQFPFETIVVVSYILVGGDIFQYNSSVEFSKRVDVAKLKFTKLDSDTLTFLNIYKQWIENGLSSSWCTDNCVDLNYLKCVQSKIVEVHAVVVEHLGIDIVCEFIRNFDWNSLQKIIFECFRDNLCVYTGHALSGYKSFTGHCIVFPHPSTCINRKENLPQYIVYDKFVAGSRNFVTQITSVPGDVVTEAFDKGLLKGVAREALFQQKLEPCVIEGVGLTIIKQILTRKKLRDLEEKIKKETKSELVVVEPCEEEGNVTLYTLPGCRDRAKEIVTKSFSEDREKLLEEKETIDLVFQKGDTTVNIGVTWSKGATISSVITGTIQNRSTSSDSSSVNSASNVQIDTICKCILLTWPCRLCNGQGTIDFENDKDFSIVNRKLCISPFVQVKDCSVEICVGDTKKQKNRMDVVGGLDPTTTDEDLERAIQNFGVGDFHAKVHYSPSVEITIQDIQRIEASLLSQFIVLFDDLVHSVEVQIPTNAEETTMTAEVQFSNMVTHNLEDIAVGLNEVIKVDGVIVKAESLYYSHLFCSIEIWDKLKSRIADACENFRSAHRSESCKFVENDYDSGTKRLKISAQNEQNLKELQREIQELLQGHVLTPSKKASIRLLFCHGGYLWLRALEVEKNVYIIDDYNTMTVHLYGCKENCRSAVGEIENYLKAAEKHSVFQRNLNSVNASVLRAVIQKYGVNLKKFVVDSGLRSAEIKIRECQLIGYGSSESIDKAQKLLDEIEDECGSNCTKLKSGQEMCHVCICPALSNTLRLELCGHLYCGGECLRHLEENLVKNPVDINIPVACCAEGCGKPIILEDIRRICEYDEERIKNLLRICLKLYLSQNRNIMYCPALDCSMFVDKESLPDSKWECPLCHNFICTNCKAIYHVGYDCDMYQGMQRNENHSYEVWTQDENSDSKRCPNCECPIERTEGCNNMFCTRCSKHFCWNCAQFCGSEDDVYRHQGSCSGFPKK